MITSNVGVSASNPQVLRIGQRLHSLDEHCHAPSAADGLRACHCVLKLSRTITDLAGSEAIVHDLLAEALQ